MLHTAGIDRQAVVYHNIELVRISDSVDPVTRCEGTAGRLYWRHRDNMTMGDLGYVDDLPGQQVLNCGSGGANLCAKRNSDRLVPEAYPEYGKRVLPQQLEGKADVL